MTRTLRFYTFEGFQNPKSLGQFLSLGLGRGVLHIVPQLEALGDQVEFLEHVPDGFAAHAGLKRADSVLLQQSAGIFLH